MEHNEVNQRVSELRKDFGEKTSENIYGMEEQAKKEVNYLDLKKAIKEVDATLEKLNKEFDKELDYAREFGMTPEVANHIAEMSKEIRIQTDKFLRLNKDVDKAKEEIKINIIDAANDATIKTKEGIKQIANGLLDKAVSGVATIGALTDKIAEANQKAASMVKAEVDTVYTNLEESINNVHRNYLSFNYNKDKALTGSLDKITVALESQFQKSASIKEAFKDLGRAFLGRERQGDKGEFTQSEKAVVETLKNISDSLKRNMAETEKQFNLSKQLSVQNIKSSKELREAAGLKENNALEERFKAAKEQSLDSQKEKSEKTAEKQKDIAPKNNELDK